MRTKYGSQRQIAEVAELLADDETLVLLAVGGCPSTPDPRDGGLLALTDQRLLFVPRDAGDDPRVWPLDRVSTVAWTPDRSGGTFAVASEDDDVSFDGLANADGRDLCAAVVRLRPSVRRVEPA